MCFVATMTARFSPERNIEHLKGEMDWTFKTVDTWEVFIMAPSVNINNSWWQIKVLVLDLKINIHFLDFFL